MSFEIRGAVARITDAARARMAAWKVKTGGRKASDEQLEDRIEKAAMISAIIEKPGWKIIKEYIEQRKDAADSAFEAITVTSQEKALELAKVQGRKSELRLLDEWIELQIKRGAEASKALSSNGQNRKGINNG
jgi:hypothetical protein